MITIDETITVPRILEDAYWESYPLELTDEGVRRFKTQTQSDSRKPIVYVHVESRTGRVLRIGYSSEGIYYRWTKNTNGHIATFEWAMKLSQTYKGMAPRFPQYVLFFNRLVNMKTTVWTVECCDQSAKVVEKVLTDAFTPVWEQFNSRCRSASVRPGQIGSLTVNDRTYSAPGLPELRELKSGRIWPFECN